MRNSFYEWIETVFSLCVFAVIALAVASTTYQLFNPEGGLIQWLVSLWNMNPVMVILLGGVLLLVKRWLSGLQGARAADVIFYAAVMLGLYYGYDLLVSA